MVKTSKRRMILFSERRHIADLVEEWYLNHPQAERCTLNTVTAIHNLKLLKHPDEVTHE